MINESRIVEQFCALVRVDSETGNERRICDVLKEIFQSVAPTAIIFEDQAASITGHGAGNLFIKIPPTYGFENSIKLLFTCHMDTVRPGQGIKPRVDNDGYIRSDGTTILGSDDKAGIAALIEALQVIKEQQLSHGAIQLVITVGEEAGLVGAKAIDPNHLDADIGYAFDSNGAVGEIVVAGPTQAKINATIKGRAAHAGVNPEQGISAIQVASRAISKMPLGRIDHETTANIGKFVGGGETNIVCDSVELFAEARSHQQDKLDDQLKAMEKALLDAAEQFGAHAGFQAEIVYPSFAYDETAEVVKIARSAMTAIDRKVNLVKSGGGSDANIFNGFGIPTLNLAIGYEHIHTTNEQMPISELLKSSELVLAIIKEAQQP
jgi:tripeptide aminopeptidase